MRTDRGKIWSPGNKGFAWSRTSSRSSAIRAYDFGFYESGGSPSYDNDRHTAFAVLLIALFNSIG